MRDQEVMEMFTRIGAYKQGHFKLSSGLHSAAYLQCALIFSEPVLAKRVCSSLAEKIRMFEPDVVIGPAMGGIVLAYEMGRILKTRAIFTERETNGKMVLKRGFIVSPQNRVLIAEDVLTTGKSVKEVIDLLKQDGIAPVGIASIVDRSRGKLDFGGIKYESLIKLDVPVFEENKCPLCQEGIPIVKPGSRK
ncbi:MAG: orotate phosphoribosyltransferase [Candidatus Omnitrophica bacterium]|nr:orotate phosphoribosyltransferase [Candidatus Omnitrophota bacterium]